MEKRFSRLATYAAPKLSATIHAIGNSLRSFLASLLRVCQFSRDAEWISYTSYPEGTLWRSRIDGSERLQLTFPPMRVLLPKWSPDGRQIAFAASFPGRPRNIYLISAEGGTPKQVLPDAEDRVDGNWSSDGNSLFFGSFGGNLHGQ